MNHQHVQHTSNRECGFTRTPERASRRAFAWRNLDHARLVSGFTLVETLVALALLTVALVPMLGVAFTANRIAGSLRDDMIASDLAQEGIEVVRAVRDTNWFSGQTFTANMTMGDHELGWRTTAITSPYLARFLKLSADGVYNYASGTDTIFQRNVTLTQVSATELKIVSEVTWKDRSRDRSVSVETHLFNWNQ